MGAFILFILWLVGLIVLSIELWGPSGVNSSCQIYVSVDESHGQSIDTLAWLEQHSICEFPFSFEVIWADMVVGEEWKAELCLCGSRQRTLG